MNNKGFTLIELMIAVVVIGILAAIAIPNYQQFVRKSKRTDATTALIGLQQAQAKLRANCRWYAGALGNPSSCEATAAATTINYPATSENGLYEIKITAADASGNSYTVTAEAIATESQSGDTDCQVFVLRVTGVNANGAKTSINSDPVESTVANDTCW